MPVSPPIRILAPAQESGDLFGRLVSDLFLALGYDEPRLNIHKAGREIDVLAKHRLEPRWVVAECKATAKPIGGDDINKFVGALQAERRKLGPDAEVAGYFLSLSGFTETALEQERDLGQPPRLTLLDGRRIVEELVHGRIVASPERAYERSGRSAASAGKDLVPEGQPQLLAHAIGWVWAVRFRRNAEPTHVAFVHADGEILSPALAKEIQDMDLSLRGDLHRLACLSPEDPDEEETQRLAEARQAYFAYLAAECGEIELEGLPADREVGSRRLRLESLFVPLHLKPIPPEEDPGSRIGDGPHAGQLEESLRLPVGETLARRSRLAILAVPGGGKTTLLKRLAVSYAFPERRTDLGDRLPDREWFPVLLRCRQIGDRAHEPVIELLARLGERAEMGSLAGAFRSLLLEALREGRALLLVDGLDEIADNGRRAAFVNQLRTFLSTYPGADVVVTSREAGFRAVAGTLGAHCDHYRIADFSREDIERLTVAWHREVVGARPDVESEARSLAATIWENDRVRHLAVNPLLLTTLLLVRRWVGQIPNRRAVLYGKAIEVLLWTWNVQGFEPLDVQEVVPQLAFLAWTMMEGETQRISQPRLREVLQAARRQMPEVLAYARLSVSEFVDRVERRSGLLVLSGHEIENGRLVPLYEFRHLTFQEYLAAIALAEGYYPDRKEEDTLLAKLEPHFQHAAWKEVISLAVVLAGRRAIPLVERLVELTFVVAKGRAALVAVLAQCLLDEVQIPPGLVEKALEAVCRASGFGGLENVYQLAASRYGETLRKVAWDSFCVMGTQMAELGVSLVAAESLVRRWGRFYEEPRPGQLEAIRNLISSKAPQERSIGLLGLKDAAFFITQALGDDKELRGEVASLVPWVMTATQSLESWEQFSAAWALVWAFRAGAGGPNDLPTARRLLELTLNGNFPDIRRMAAWALSEMPFVDRDELGLNLSRSEESQIRSYLEEVSPRPHPAFYGRLYTDQDLTEKILAVAVDHGDSDTNVLRRLLGCLGGSGREALPQLDRLEEARRPKHG